MADDQAAPDPEQIATQADFGRELQALRDRAGLKIRAVAKASGVPVSTTGDYFSGRHLPTDPQQLLRILDACGEKDPARMALWEAALQRARRPPGRRTDTPYRGLARFEVADARWFFGREDVTEQFVSLAAESSPLPLMLVGPSGAGKSSLLRAGVLPRLRELAQAAPGISGPVTIFEPGATPLAELRAHVAGTLTLGGGRNGNGNGSGAAGGHARSEGGRPTVIVDQFEGVFTLCPDEAARRDFVTALCELAHTTLVILALRADFYDHAIRYPGLAKALQSRQVVLGPMTGEQVRRVITEPARLARVNVEDGLVGLLLSDLAPSEGADGAYERGALPLLSHAMLATWEHSRGGTLSIADYLASGGIKDALTQTAERAYGGLSPDQRKLARRLFLRLVHVADDLPPSRATVELRELRHWGEQGGQGGQGGQTRGDADRVLATFVDERMIAVDEGTARITHDALLTAWPRLRSWIEGGMDGLRTRRRITEGARAWDDADRESAALWRGSQLEVARDWAADEDNGGLLPALAAEFVSASIAEEGARRRAERHRTRRLRGIVAALTALVVVVAMLTVYAVQQRHAVTTAQHLTSAGEAALEADQIRGQDPPLAAQLSVSAYGLVRTEFSTASLLESSGTPSAARIVDSTGIVQWAALSPDHRLLAAAGADGTLRLWDVATPGHPWLVDTVVAANVNEPLYVAAFSPDGKVLAAAGAGQVVRLWDVSDPASPRPLGAPLTGATSTIYSVAFSPDGQVLAAGSADESVRLWDVGDPAHGVPLGGPLTVPDGKSAVQSVAFSPNGAALAAGTASGSVCLWNVTNPARPVMLPGMPLTGPALAVSGVAFSPDGRLLAAASQDKKVWLWRLAGGAGGAVPDGTLTGATSWANTVAFSPDGRSLAEGTSDANVLVWNLATRALSATLPQSQPVTSVTWDGPKRIVSSDADGTVDLWMLPTPVLPTANNSTSVAYSPDGRTLAVGGLNLQVWSMATREQIAVHTLAANSFVNALAYSPDGRVIAAAYSDGTAGLLDASTLEPLGAPLRVTASGTAESVAFSPDGKTLATGADDGSVRLWSVADPAQPQSLALIHDSGTYVYTVLFSPDGKTLAAASTDNLTRLWNVADPARPVRLGKPLGGFTSYAIGLAFTPDGKTLAVSSADKTVRLWNVSNPARPALIGTPLTGPTGYVWAVAFSPDGKTLAAGSTDGTVWLWNVTNPGSPSPIATLTGADGHVYSVAFAPAGGELAATSDAGTVHLWDTNLTTAEADICANLGQPLSGKEWSAYIPDVPYHAPCS